MTGRGARADWMRGAASLPGGACLPAHRQKEDSTMPGMLATHTPTAQETALQVRARLIELEVGGATEWRKFRRSWSWKRSWRDIKQRTQK